MIFENLDEAVANEVDQSSPFGEDNGSMYTPVGDDFSSISFFYEQDEEEDVLDLQVVDSMEKKHAPTFSSNTRLHNDDNHLGGNDGEHVTVITCTNIFENLDEAVANEVDQSSPFGEDNGSMYTPVGDDFSSISFFYEQDEEEDVLDLQVVDSMEKKHAPTFSSNTRLHNDDNHLGGNDGEHVSVITCTNEGNEGESLCGLRSKPTVPEKRTHASRRSSDANKESENDKEDNTITTKLRKPKRPVSAYNIFFKWKRRELVRKDIHGKLTFSQIGKLIGEQWKTINESDRANYDRQAKSDQLRYREEISLWKKQKQEHKRRFKRRGGSRFKRERNRKFKGGSEQDSSASKRLVHSKEDARSSSTDHVTLQTRHNNAVASKKFHGSCEGDHEQRESSPCLNKNDDHKRDSSLRQDTDHGHPSLSSAMGAHPFLVAAFVPQTTENLSYGLAGYAVPPPPEAAPAASSYSHFYSGHPQPPPNHTGGAPYNYHCYGPPNSWHGHDYTHPSSYWHHAPNSTVPAPTSYAMGSPSSSSESFFHAAPSPNSNDHLLASPPVPCLTSKSTTHPVPQTMPFVPFLPSGTPNVSGGDRPSVDSNTKPQFQLQCTFLRMRTKRVSN